MLGLWDYPGFYSDISQLDRQGFVVQRKRQDLYARVVFETVQQMKNHHFRAGPEVA
jgi:hypothetical protein